MRRAQYNDTLPPVSSLHRFPLLYFVSTDMSLAALRASTRRIKVAVPAARASPRSGLRNQAFRRYSTEPSSPAPKGSNTALFGAIGIAAVGGVAFWVYTSNSDSAREAGTALKSGAQAAKAAANFTPTKEDYQKVRVLFCGICMGRMLSAPL